MKFWDANSIYRAVVDESYQETNLIGQRVEILGTGSVVADRGVVLGVRFIPAMTGSFDCFVETDVKYPTTPSEIIKVEVYKIRIEQ